MKSVDPNVKVHLHDEGNGIVGIRREWEIEKSPQAFLRELAVVLRLGGRMTADGTKFTAPYVFTDFPEVESSHLPDYALRPECADISAISDGLFSAGAP